MKYFILLFFLISCNPINKENESLIKSNDYNDLVNLFLLASWENPPDSVAPLNEHLLMIK